MNKKVSRILLFFLRSCPQSQLQTQPSKEKLKEKPDFLSPVLRPIVMQIANRITMKTKSRRT